MHQFTKRRFILDLRVDIDDMSLIIKDHSGFLNSSVNMINRKPRPQNIVFCDKDDISFIQRIVFLTGICQICIKQAAIVASTFSLAPRSLRWTSILYARLFRSTARMSSRTERPCKFLMLYCP